MCIRYACLPFLSNTTCNAVAVEHRVANGRGTEKAYPNIDITNAIGDTLPSQTDSNNVSFAFELKWHVRCVHSDVTSG